MYLRLMITIPLSFYTSRVVLQQLGVDDYGIYQTVAGIITLFAVLRGAFDSATQRYYNVAIAQDDTGLLSKMFSTSLVVHLGITLFLVLFVCVFGMWFICYKMQYPPEKQSDVFFVFGTMVISIVFIVMNIPFSGMIIAKEHMKFYSYQSIIDVVFKLGLVFFLIFIHTNKLKIYAWKNLSNSFQPPIRCIHRIKSIIKITIGIIT